MGMAEGRRIFQAVSEGSVEPQMGNPDEGVRYDLRIENKACREQSERDNIGMEAIINKSPGSGAAIIGQKRKVWGEEQDCEKNPTRTRLRIAAQAAARTAIPSMRKSRRTSSLTKPRLGNAPVCFAD
jgi:hypothetical protein